MNIIKRIALVTNLHSNLKKSVLIVITRTIIIRIKTINYTHVKTLKLKQLYVIIVLIKNYNIPSGGSCDKMHGMIKNKIGIKLE